MARDPDAVPERREIVERVQKVISDILNEQGFIHPQRPEAKALCSRLAHAAIAALQQESPRAEVIVRDLGWSAPRTTEDGSLAYDAETSIGHYIATDAGWFLLGRSGWIASASLDAAKAAAQADFEARINSALAHPLHQPAPDAGKPDRRHDIARIVIDAVRNTRKRPAGLRGPYVFDDAELDEIIASYDAAPAPEPQAPMPDGVTEALAQIDAFIRVPYSGYVNGISKDHLRRWRAALTASAKQGSGE